MNEKLKSAYFNTCPLCKDEGKIVHLEISRDDEYTKPCRECGTQFGKFFYKPKMVKND